MVELVLSNSLGWGSRWPTAASFDVKGGSVESVRAFRSAPDRFHVYVRPNSRKAVAVTLSGGRACDAAGAVCTADGRALSHSPNAAVAGPDGALSSDADLSRAVGRGRAKRGGQLVGAGHRHVRAGHDRLFGDGAARDDARAPHGNGCGLGRDAEGGRGLEPDGGDGWDGERRDRAQRGCQRAKARGDGRGRHGQDLRGNGDPGKRPPSRCRCRPPPRTRWSRARRSR